MRTWWMVLAVTLYLSLDVANPLMPGAVTFGSDSSLELRQAERLRGDHDVAAPSETFDPIRAVADDVITSPPRPVEARPSASPPVRGARSALFTASVASEDPLTV